MSPIRSQTRFLALFGLILVMVVAMAGVAKAQEPAPADEQMQAVLDELASLEPPPIPSLTPEEARMQPSPADAVMSLLSSEGMSTDPEPVGNVEDRTIPGPAGDIPVRVYTPEGDGPFPVIVYYHGGGWVIATIDTYDSSARALTNAAGAVVMSVEYRKAPENPYPAPLDDSYAAYLWAVENAAEINGDAANVAVAGESAGGNLATVVAMRARDEGEQLPVHQLLVYPITNSDFETESYIENATAKPLDLPTMQWFWDQYIADEAARNDPYASPLQAEDLSGMPPATIVLAQIDPLRSEGEAYGAALEAAGVPVEMQLWEGVTHEFFGMGVVVDKALEAVAFAADGLTASFTTAGATGTGGGTPATPSTPVVPGVPATGAGGTATSSSQGATIALLTGGIALAIISVVGFTLLRRRTS